MYAFMTAGDEDKSHLTTYTHSRPRNVHEGRKDGY